MSGAAVAKAQLRPHRQGPLSLGGPGVAEGVGGVATTEHSHGFREQAGDWLVFWRTHSSSPDGLAGSTEGLGMWWDRLQVWKTWQEGEREERAKSGRERSAVAMEATCQAQTLTVERGGRRESETEPEEMAGTRGDRAGELHVATCP